MLEVQVFPKQSPEYPDQQYQKDFDYIRHEDIEVSLPGVTGDLFSVNSAGVASINRSHTFTSTEYRVVYPRLEPVLNVG